MVWPQMVQLYACCSTEIPLLTRIYGLGTINVTTGVLTRVPGSADSYGIDSTDTRNLSLF